MEDKGYDISLTKRAFGRSVQPYPAIDMDGVHLSTLHYLCGQHDRISI